MRTIQPADEGAPPATRLVGKVALPTVHLTSKGTIRLATILGMLATAVLRGIVAACAAISRRFSRRTG